MEDVLQLLEEREVECSTCGKSACFKSFVLRDTRPHKTITVKECTNCGLTETAEDDCETLDYGVKISCDFMDNSPDNMRRMAFINSRAEATFYTSDSEIFSFSAERGNIDCIEGLIMRGDEVLSFGSKGNVEVKDRRRRLEEIMNGRGFRLVITDNTGYSRVCPAGMEYTRVQDIALEDLSRMDPQVLHEKMPKKEE